MTILYDAYDRPIDKTRLREEVAAPTVTGVRQILSGHPAQNLSPRRLANLLLAAEQGDAVAYLELAEEMEEKDLHYRSVLNTRKLQVSGLPIQVDAASDAADDKRAAELVSDFIDTGILQSALQDIMDCIGKGYSACEIMWDTTGKVWQPSAIQWRDPRWFQFDPVDGTTLLLKDEYGNPMPLPPAKFIRNVHHSKSGLPIRGGLARPVAWYYLFKNFDLKAWVQFAQVYGFPLRIGRYDSQATQEERQTLLRAVRNISQDAAAIIPQGMSIDFQSTDARGNSKLFEDMALYFDRQISKLILGQTGTTDVGQHVGTANAHERVRMDIAKSDAAQLSAVLNRDLVRPMVALNCGAKAKYPVLRVVCEEAEDVSAWFDDVTKILPFVPEEEGLAELSIIRDKLRVPAPAKGAVVISRAPKPKEPEKAEEKPARAAQSSQGPASLEPDSIDLAVREELGGWEPLISPLAAPILELAEQCSDYDEFLAALPEALHKQDVNALAKALSLAMFEQRVKAETDGGI